MWSGVAQLLQDGVADHFELIEGLLDCIGRYAFLRLIANSF